MLTSQAEDIYHLLDLKVLLPQTNVLSSENSGNQILFPNETSSVVQSVLNGQ